MNKGAYSQQKLIESVENGFKNLRGANLREADLRGADLRGADLDLRGVDLSGTDFRSADLTGVNLSGVNFSGVNFSGALLSKADLSKADLRGASLRGASLSEADLSEADLSEADLRGAYLSEADLSGADLSGANLSGVDLEGADLTGADLSEADLTGADLSETNLSGANLRAVNLIVTNLNKANITGVKLYGTFRDNWKIDCIKCGYVYRDEAGEERTPRDRDFGQGEFEEVYKWRSLNDFERLIVKSVEFPEEYFEAGKSVLSYFGSILRKKYPDTKANVQIKQDGLRVTMIIDLTEGVREVIEKELDKYGLAITEKMTLEEYADNDPLLLIELKSQLNIARMQLENQKLIDEHQNRERDIQIDKLLSLVGQGIQR